MQTCMQTRRRGSRSGESSDTQRRAVQRSQRRNPQRCNASGGGCICISLIHLIVLSLLSLDVQLLPFDPHSPPPPSRPPPCRPSTARAATLCCLVRCSTTPTGPMSRRSSRMMERQREHWRSCRSSQQTIETRTGRRRCDSPKGGATALLLNSQF